MKYIETELKKRKGIVENEEQKVKLKNAEDSLYELPENIRVSSAKKTEEMLSNQMLSGIPEVDLGIEYVVHKSVSYGLNYRDEHCDWKLLISRALMWLHSATPLWLCDGIQSWSGLVGCLALSVKHSNRIPVQHDSMSSGKRHLHFCYCSQQLSGVYQCMSCTEIGCVKDASLLPFKPTIQASKFL